MLVDATQVQFIPTRTRNCLPVWLSVDIFQNLDSNERLVIFVAPASLGVQVQVGRAREQIMMIIALMDEFN